MTAPGVGACLAPASRCLKIGRAECFIVLPGVVSWAQGGIVQVSFGRWKEGRAVLFNFFQIDWK